jgi:hypothetical protein
MSIPKIIEKKERIEVTGIAKAERPAQMDASAFQCRFGLHKSFNGPDGHMLQDTGTA